jgi:hypothetical protein
MRSEWFKSQPKKLWRDGALSSSFRDHLEHVLGTLNGFIRQSVYLFQIKFHILGIRSVEDFYKLTRKQIQDAGGGALFGHR